MSKTYYPGVLAIRGPNVIESERTKILINQAACLRCFEVIESTHRHDFVACGCKAICVDGGREYLRRVCRSYDDLLDMSVTITTTRLHNGNPV